MPTVFVLDVSLSMQGVVASDSTVHDDNKPQLTRRKLAIFGLTQLAEQVAQLNKCEQFALITFASSAQVVQAFDRDPGIVADALRTQSEPDTRSFIIPALRLASSLCSSCWGSQTFCQIIVVTDGSCHEANVYQSTDVIDDLPVPFDFPCMLHVVCFNPEGAAGTNMEFYNYLFAQNDQTDGFHILSAMHLNGVQELFSTIAQQYYTPFSAVLRCGQLLTDVSLCPAPRPYQKTVDFEVIKRTMNDTVDIVGFTKSQDLGSPAIFSRHIFLPINSARRSRNTKGHPDGRNTANVQVLLHDAMKQENLVPFCQVGTDWFGFLSIQANSKASNVILNVMQPGSLCVPWLGNLHDLRVRPYSLTDAVKDSPFPVSFPIKPSYATTPGCSYWIQQYGMQSDIQKVIRYAKKLGEGGKDGQFYQELNRVCNYALSIGCTEFFALLRATLEKEKATLALQNNATVIVKHLTYVIQCLGVKKLSYGEPVKPLA